LLDNNRRRHFRVKHHRVPREQSVLLHLGISRRLADRNEGGWMNVVLDPSRKRNVGDEIVRPPVAVAIGTTACLGDDASGSNLTLGALD
jgi:hypothetical protein